MADGGALAGTGVRRDAVFGLLRLAGTDVALPVDVLREVVPCPAHLAPLPAHAPGLLGAMTLRSLVLPVVDLGNLLGAPAARTGEQVVVVVACAGRLIGLLADEVRGVAQVPGTALLPVSAAGGGLVFSHTFQHPEDGRVVSVLDAAALLQRPGLPTALDAPAVGTAPPGASRGRSAGATRGHTLLRCGAYLLALDVTHVHTTLLAPPVRESVLDSALCRGVTDVTDREVPVVDPLVLLGLGRLADDEAGAGLVLDFEHGYVVIALGGLVDLVPLAPGDVLPLPAYAASRPDLVSGIADLPGAGQCLVLDGSALLTDPALVSLASVNTATGGAAELSTAGGSASALPTQPGAADAPDAGGAPPRTRRRPYLTYAAGTDLATPLGQVAEILPVPAQTLVAGGVGAVLGVVVHRRTVVPVLCLASLLGRAPREDAGNPCVLLVEGDAGPVAFAVDGLSSIDELSWKDPDRRPAQSGLDRLLQRSPLVRVGAGDRLVPELDLVGLARTVQGVEPAGDVALVAVG